MQDNPWVEWAEKIRAIAQTGTAYSENDERAKFDLERYHQLQTIAHEMTAQLTGAPRGKVDDYFLPEKGYTTPKLDLRAGIFKDGKILLVKERSDDCWSLPGGWADVCEPPSCGIEREVMEESGYRARAGKLVAVRDAHRHAYHPRNPHHIYKMLFLCQLEGGEARSNIEISEIDFFPLDQLPELSRGRTITEDIHLLKAHLDDISLPTSFD